MSWKHRPPSTGRCLAWSIGAFVVGALGASPLLAGNQFRLDAPGTPRRSLSGIQITAESTWVQGNGYRPVKVTLRRISPGPGSPEREFLVELFVSYPNSNLSHGQTTSQYITLPEGSREVTETMLVPQTHQWPVLRLDVWEDGRELEDLSGAKIGIGARQQRTEGLPKILIVDSDAPTRQELDRGSSSGTVRRGQPGDPQLPDLRTLYRFLPNSINTPVQGNALPADALSLVSLLDDIHLTNPKDAPTRWQGYTCLDLVFISLSDLTAMAADEPQRWRAMRDWVRAGGTLCVYELGTRFEHLEALETVCKLPGSAAPGGAFPGWAKPTAQDEKVAIFETLDEAQRMSAGRFGPTATTESATERTFRSKPVTADGQPIFLTRPWHLGTVVAFGPVAPFPGTDRQWGMFLNELGPSRWAWYQRHGLSMSRENEDFWNFLIPGVGTAPVGAFRVLITLFIVGIGPVNYFLLRRWQRLHWLLVTVPVGAVVVTVGLFAYAMLSEGFASRVRIRSLTHIDQRQGHAVSWSRQSYYAGLAPSQGLVFPSDTAVYPLSQFPSVEYGDEGRKSQKLHWDQSQRLQRGYITSRVTSQFMAVCSRPSAAQLHITTGPGAPTRIDNQLGVDLRQVVVRDGSGTYYHATDVPAGSQRPMSESTAVKSFRMLQPLFAATQPALPEGFEAQNYRGAASFFRPYPYRYWSLDYNLPQPRVGTSVLDRKLRELLGPSRLDLEPGSYVAVARRPPEVPVGIPGAEEVAGLHVITGTW